MGRTTTEGLRFFLTIYSSLSRYLSSYNLGSLSSQRIRLESELNGEETLVRVEIKGFGNLRFPKKFICGRGFAIYRWSDARWNDRGTERKKRFRPTCGIVIEDLEPRRSRERGDKGNDRSKKPTLPILLTELEAKHRKVGNADCYVWLVKSSRRLLFIFSRWYR